MQDKQVSFPVDILFSVAFKYLQDLLLKSII